MGQLSPRRVPVIPLSIIVSFVVGLVSNLLAGAIQQYVFGQIYGVVIVSSLVIFAIVGLLIGAFLEHRPLVIPLKKFSYLMLVIIVTSVVILTTTLSWMFAALRPPTTYFLVDATENMQPIFEEVRSEVANAIVPNSRIGLRVYGGNVTGLTGCDNTKQVIAPDVYSDPEAKIESTLALVEPNGHSSLVGAVLDTLDDLAGHNEPIKLVIITSGTDPECDPLEGGILQSRAGDIKSNINIVIVSIGKLDTNESQILGSYALAFHAGYWNINSPAQLPQVVQTVSSYGSQDYLYSNLTPTPTPSP